MTKPMPAQLHPLTLSFRDPEVERVFAGHLLGRLRVQGRVAILVGTLIYLTSGFLDGWLVPPEHRVTAWVFRLSALTYVGVVFLLTFRPAFERFNQLPLGSTGLVVAASLIGILYYLPLEATPYFYPCLILSTFYTYNFIGTRFIYALVIDIVVVISYNLILGGLREFPVPMLLSHNFFIISANLIGGGAGYLAEFQRRQLFIREAELERERQHHLDRSLHDRLTGLPNRELLEDRIAQLLVRTRRDKACHVALFVDLDGFKEINDNFGHDHGDAVLCAVARRLVAAVRQTDTVSRLGGDEFFVLAHDVGTEVDAGHLAEKLLSAIVAPFPGLNGTARLGASIGICIFCGATHGDSGPDEIIREADRAMYVAKGGGKHCYAFAPR